MFSWAQRHRGDSNTHAPSCSPVCLCCVTRSEPRPRSLARQQPLTQATGSWPGSPPNHLPEPHAPACTPMPQRSNTPSATSAAQIAGTVGLVLAGIHHPRRPRMDCKAAAAAAHDHRLLCPCRAHLFLSLLNPRTSSAPCVCHCCAPPPGDGGVSTHPPSWPACQGLSPQRQARAPAPGPTLWRRCWPHTGIAMPALAQLASSTLGPMPLLRRRFCIAFRARCLCGGCAMCAARWCRGARRGRTQVPATGRSCGRSQRRQTSCVSCWHITAQQSRAFSSSAALR